MQSCDQRCPACGTQPRGPREIGADLAELLVRVRAEIPALRGSGLPALEGSVARECAIMNRWMAGLGLALDVRTAAWPLVLELDLGMCAGCAAREARRRRKVEDAAAIVTPPATPAAALPV